MNIDEIRDKLDETLEQADEKLAEWEEELDNETTAETPSQTDTDKVDVNVTDTDVEVTVKVPGYPKDALSLDVSNDVVTVEMDGSDLELPTQTVEEQLSYAVDEDEGDANYEYGMLYLTLPRSDRNETVDTGLDFE